jgi:hypothetical protein
MQNVQKIQGYNVNTTTRDKPTDRLVLSLIFASLFIATPITILILIIIIASSAWVQSNKHAPSTTTNQEASLE